MPNVMRESMYHFARSTATYRKIKTSILKADYKPEALPLKADARENPEPLDALPPKSEIMFDDFNGDASQWAADGFVPEIKDGALYWNDALHRPLISKKTFPIEDVIVEINVWCESDGLPIRLENEQGEGYVVVLGSWRNTRSHAARISDPVKWEIGKHLQFKQWQHYRIVRQGDLLEVYVDGKNVVSRELPGRYAGLGTIRLCSYSKVGIDNVRIYETGE